MKLSTRINRFRSSNPEYMKRVEELKRKEYIRFNRQHGLSPSEVKCRVHGKKRNERIMLAFHKMDERTAERYVDLNWHGVIDGKYEYMESHWVWVTDIRYYPLERGDANGNDQ